MDRSFILKALLSSIVLLVLFLPVRANTLIEEKTIAGNHLKNNLTPLVVVNEYLQQDDKQKKVKKPDNNQKPNQPDIKTVPKARKQPRPTVVAKPNVKPKPIKVVRPNIRRP